MCSNCAAAYAMQESLDFKLNGKKYFVLAIPLSDKEREGPAKWQIRKDGWSWRDKWKKSDHMGWTMGGMGLDVHDWAKGKQSWKTLIEAVEFFTGDKHEIPVIEKPDIKYVAESEPDEGDVIDEQADKENQILE